MRSLKIVAIALATLLGLTTAGVGQTPQSLYIITTRVDGSGATVLMTVAERLTASENANIDLAMKCFSLIIRAPRPPLHYCAVGDAGMRNGQPVTVVGGLDARKVNRIVIRDVAESTGPVYTLYDASWDSHSSYMILGISRDLTSEPVAVMACREDADRKTRDPVNLAIDKLKYSCVVGDAGLGYGQHVEYANSPGVPVVDEKYGQVTLPRVVPVSR